MYQITSFNHTHEQIVKKEKRKKQTVDTANVFFFFSNITIEMKILLKHKRYEKIKRLGLMAFKCEINM